MSREISDWLSHGIPAEHPKVRWRGFHEMETITIELPQTLITRSVEWTHPAPTLSIVDQRFELWDAVRALVAEGHVASAYNSFQYRSTVQPLIMTFSAMDKANRVDQILRQRCKVPHAIGPATYGFRETLAAGVTGEAKFVRQTNGPSHFGHVVLRIEPSNRYSLLTFDNYTEPSHVLDDVIPGIIAGIQEIAVRSAVWGYPLTGLHVALVGGSYHQVDSNPRSFERASLMAIVDAMHSDQARLVEPTELISMTVPREDTGSILEERREWDIKPVEVEHRGDSTLLTGHATLPTLFRAKATLSVIMSQAEATLTPISLRSLGIDEIENMQPP